MGRFRHRVLWVAVALTLAFGGLLGRLAWLQLHDGARYRRKARDARLRVRLVRAPRGRILDRNGEVLAADLPAYRVALRLGELERGSELAPRVARILRRRRAELLERWEALRQRAARAPDGPPLPLVDAPSRTSRKLFVRLAAHEPGLSVAGSTLRVSRALLLRRERVIGRLAALLGREPGPLRDRVARQLARALAIDNRLDRAQALETPLPVALGLDFDTVAQLEEACAELPGVVVEVVARRRHPYGDTLAHVLGYTGKLTAREVRALRASGRLLVGYRGWRSLDRFLAIRAHARFLDARVGRSGLEASLEPWLSGVSGGQLVERDRRTGRYRVVSEQPPIPGRDVRLHVDAALQRQLERILDEAVERAGGRGGAAVLLGARTGAVRVLASSPRFEIDRIGAAYRRWRDDPRAPLVHRAIAAQLPPGSTVKPIMVLAALAQGGLVLDGAPVRADRRFVCRGYLYNRHAFQCHARYGHGPLTLAEALERSCNIPFYRIGEALGPEALATWYRRFGLGRRSGIDLPGERPGLVPTPRWKSRRLEAARSAERRARTRLLAALRAGGGPWRGAPWRARLGAGSRWDALQRAARRWRQAARWAARCEEDGGWRKGDSRNAAIGQGNVLATPLQLAVFAAALANGGRLVRPEVAGLRLEASPHRAPEVALEPAGLAVVREGMRLVTSGAHGTARPSVLRRADTAIDEATIALWRHAYAKTGTAQAGAVSHAWIVGWLPAPAAGDEPLAFCVLVEGIASGGGGSVAGPVAARMLRLAVAREGAP